jgi:hypothetical protein
MSGTEPTSDTAPAAKDGITTDTVAEVQEAPESPFRAIMKREKAVSEEKGRAAKKQRPRRKQRFFLSLPSLPILSLV